MMARRLAATKRIHEEVYKKDPNYTPCTNFPADKTRATWANLEEGIQEIYSASTNSPATAISIQRYLELYNLAYKYYTESQQTHNCVWNNKSNLDRILANNQLVDSCGILPRLNDFLTSYLEGKLKKLDTENIFMEYVTLFKNFFFNSKVVSGVFGYFNRITIERYNFATRPTYLLAMQNWKINLFSKHGQVVSDALVKIIADTRKGYTSSEDVIVYGVNSFLQLDLDQEVEGTVALYPTLEQQIIQDTKMFYTRFFKEELCCLSVPESVLRVESCLNEESDRSKRFFSEATYKSVMRVCEEALIEPQLDNIRKEFPLLLADNQNDDLRRVYNLTRRVDRGDRGLLLGFANDFQQHVKSIGVMAVKPTSTRQEPTEYFNALLSVYKKFQAMIQVSFNSDQIFRTSLDWASVEFVNSNCVTLDNQKKAAYLLAKYSNCLMQMRNVDAESMENHMKDFIVILKFIKEKDAFQQHYSMFLANRLTRAKSSSDEWEESMASKFALVELGEFIHKLKRMFTDMVKSEVMTAEFNAVANAHDPLLYDFSIKVLTSGNWPYTQDFQNFECPILLKIAQIKFEDYYKEKHSGRTLKWLIGRSQGEMKYYPPNSKVSYSIVVSTYQMAILLMYNDKDSIQIRTMIEITEMSFEFLIQVLEQLLKCRLLVKAVPEDDLTPDSDIQINMNYKNHKTKFDISAPTKSEAQRQTEKVDQQLLESHRGVIQASIVRIMKTEKTMRHSILVARAIEAVKNKFGVTVRDINVCIELLIQTGYIVRKENERDCFEYVA